jgi:hypothetical protein
LGEPDSWRNGQPIWVSILADQVSRFIETYSLADETWSRHDVADYIREQNGHRELTSWTVLLSCASRQTDEPGWWIDLGIDALPRVPAIARTRLAKDPTSLGVLTDPSDEFVGLSEEQIRFGDRQWREGIYQSRAEAIRNQRPPAEGLLAVYAISPHSKPRASSTSRVPLYDYPDDSHVGIAYSISFPPSESDATHEYVQGPPGGRQQ